MKKISKGYYFVAVALMLWAFVDIYHYAAIGKDLLVHYNGASIIQQLVNNSLVQGIVKAILAFLIIAIGWLKSKGKKEPIRSTTAVSLLLIVSIMGTWLASMVCLTVVTAQETYDALCDRSYDYADSVSRSGMFHEFYDNDTPRYGMQYERPDYLEYNMFFSMDANAAATHYNGGRYDDVDREKLIREIDYPMETAVLIYDADGNLLHSSEDDVMYFNYFTQDEWNTGMDSTSGLHYGWIDISERKAAGSWKDDLYLRFRTMYSGTHNLMDIAAIRVTGYFEGTELKPVVMHYITDTLVSQVVESTDQFSTGPDSYSYLVSDVDRTGKLEWQLQFDRSAEYEGDDLVTVYIDRPDMWDYHGEPLTYDGKEYESLAILTEELDLPLKDSREFHNNSIFKLNELLVFGRWVGADYESKEYLTSGKTTIDFYLVTAIRSNPLACAVSALRNIYIVTGLLALVLLLFVHSSIKRYLIQPVADIANAMEDGWRNVYHPDQAPEMWLEVEKLNSGFACEQDRRRMKDNEITRLNTALEYAKTAEQNRRQMTSNIAHELKTPLAVIHSYAEGLKEHIAEDKRDKYVDVILAEAERTDGMVLEMLDLSRLEAGRVKLSRDDFSLVTLTQSVFKKLDIAAQAKDLHITYEFPVECMLTADENRIGQVIENFATNAIKYTPASGNIAVKIKNTHAKVTFTIENESEPLPAEALKKVWDTFYRTDESRPIGGTGLGLAIAKSIIELHGGRCSVRNTSTGVEFGFTI